MKSQRRILLFRPDNIGDVVLFSGAISHIRKLYPQDDITLAVQAHIVNLVQLCPYVDRIIPIPHLLSWKKKQDTGLFRFYIYRRFRKNLERLLRLMWPQYDLILYPVGSPQTEHLELIYNLSVKNTIGIAGDTINEPETGYPRHLNPYRLFRSYLNVAKQDPWQHELVTTWRFLTHLGCQIQRVEEIQPTLWVTDADRATALQLLGEPSGPIIGLFPGASHPIRSWAIENYRRLAEIITSKGVFVIFGGPSEVSIAKDVEAALKQGDGKRKIINLTGEMTLRQLFTCISRCNILFSMETSGLHLGIAAGIPTIGIVGGGHYGRFAPWGKPDKNVVLTKQMECFHCNWQCQYENARCIQDVKAENVAEAINKILKVSTF